MAFQIANDDTPDPFMIKHNGTYILSFTGLNRIELWRSSLLHDFHDNVAARRVIWFLSSPFNKPLPIHELELTGRRPEDAGIEMSDVWAPELHVVEDYWWVYFCAAHPSIGNPSHRMYVLRGPHVTSDPMEPTSKFTLQGPIAGLPDHWAIDGTVFHLNNDLYFVYSGWPFGQTDELIQELFIVKMLDPTTVDPSIGRQRISMPEFEWEKVKDPGDGLWHEINEGPQWLEMQSFRGIVYSAGASWTSNYNLGILEYVGGDPLQPQAWKKHPTPLLTNDHSGQGPYGPGNCSFVPSPDNSQMWIVYHATASPHDGWANRKGRCQPLELRDGCPYAGQHPVRASSLPLPSGSFIPSQSTPLPETVLGPGSWSNDPDMQRLKEKGKNLWQSVKRRLSKTS